MAQRIEYVCTPQVLREDGRLRRAYSFHVLAMNKNSVQTIATFEDICQNQREAEALVAIFRRNQVPPSQVRDVLEDYIEAKQQR
jgi:hypothetical protein